MVRTMLRIDLSDELRDELKMLALKSGKKTLRRFILETIAGQYPKIREKVANELDNRG